ncbi:MAG: hypothetical protein H3C33_16630 [Rhodocyclaceae bacterium]|nr:hypothetical protein [Rhodocyclaceae bacterium]MBW7862707.1 hypothetical protein [Rhodocyclaceae bacterium]
MAATYNCLPEGETLAELVAREGIESIDILLCRNEAPEGAAETRFEVCAPHLAEIACIYAVTATGEATPVHDVDLTSAGADQLAATVRALFVAILDARRDAPDAAQRHQAEQDAISALSQSIE